MKKRVSRAAVHESQAQSGISPAAQPFHPSDLQEEADLSEPTTRSAPAPGVPVSAQEYKIMKDRAKRPKAPRTTDAQEDPGGKQKEG